MVNVLNWPLLLLLALLTCCQEEPVMRHLAVEYPHDDTPEAAFVRDFLADTARLEALGIQLLNADAQNEPAIRVSFFSGWESAMPEGTLILTRAWFVPRDDPLAGRTDTTSAHCLAGEETLIPVAELAPPFVALRVDGLTVSDTGYPLVKMAGIVVRGAEQDMASAVPSNELEAIVATFTAALWEAATLAKVSDTGQKVSGTKTEALPAKVSDTQTGTLSAKVSDTGPGAIFWIAAGGDVLLDRGADKLLLDEGPRAIFGETAPYLAAADLALINLECAVTDRGEPIPKSYNFRCAPAAMQALRDAGVDAVLLANNHVFDFGETGFLDTLSHVKTAGIGALGVGLNERDAAAPFVFGGKGATEGKIAARIFGVASYPREKNGWDGLTVAATADSGGLLHARKGGGEQLKVNFVKDDPALDIVLFHGGEEWTDQPDEKTRAFYTDLIEGGADLIIGSHPHVVQGFEWIQGKPVFWSLGDYVFGDMADTHDLGGEDGLFIMLGFLGNRLFYLEPYPVALSDIRTSIAPRENLRRFYALSQKLREGHYQSD